MFSFIIDVQREPAHSRWLRNSVDMRSMTLEKAYTKSTHEFFIKTLRVPSKSLWNAEKMGVMSVELFWTNSTHAFTVITLLHSKQSPWNSVDMDSMTLKAVSTNCAHEFTKFQSADFQGNLICLLEREFQGTARVLMKNSWLELVKKKFDQFCPWVHADNSFALNSWAKLVKTTSSQTNQTKPTKSYCR